MTPKPLPSRLRKKLGDMPTLEQLREQHPTLKLYQLRALLKDVSCYRCPDQTVRYDRNEATEALSKPPPAKSSAAGDDDDDDDDDDLEDEEREPRTLTAMALYNEQLKQNAENRRSQTELMKIYESGFKAMIEPMKLGCSMLTETVQELRAELKLHHDRWDKVILLSENLSSHAHERDLERKKEESKTEFRKGLGQTVIELLPTALEKLQTKKPPAAAAPASSSPPTPPPAPAAPSSSGADEPAATKDEAAALALEAIASLEPEFFDVFTSNLEPPQQEKFAKVKTALTARKEPEQPPQREHADQSLNHAAAPPS